MLKRIQEHLWNHPYKYDFSYLNISEIRNFQNFYTIEPQHFFQHLVGPKQLASPSVFKDFRWWNLDTFWKSESHKNTKKYK